MRPVSTPCSPQHPAGPGRASNASLKAIERGPIGELIALGLLPRSFARYPADDRNSMLAGALRMLQKPFIRRMMSSLKFGDVILVHGEDPLVTPLDGGTLWVHSAIVSSVHPPKVIEALGPNPKGVCEVREVPLAEFVDGTRGDGYKVIHPSSSKVTLERAVRFARAQVGKPYDFTFGLLAPSGGQSWFCSNLVVAAYARAAGGKPSPLAVQKTPGRDATVALVRDLARMFGVADKKLLDGFFAEAAASDLMLPRKEAMVSSAKLFHDFVTQVLAKSATFGPVVSDPDGAAALVTLLQKLGGQAEAGKLTAWSAAAAFSSAILKVRPLAWPRLMVEAVRGLLDTKWDQGVQGAKAELFGQEIPDFVSPADIAAGDNRASQTFGKAA